MVVLNKNHCRLIGCFLQNGCSEDLICLAIAFPFRRREVWSLIRMVAQGPKSPVREPTVVLAPQSLRQPHSPQFVGGTGRRNHHAGVSIHHIPVRCSAALRHPNPSPAAQQRTQSCRQTSCRLPAYDPPLLALVAERFSIGGHYQTKCRSEERRVGK